MPKVLKQRRCIGCSEDKVARDHFTGAAKTCKSCLGAGRTCPCCKRSSQPFALNKSRCRACNAKKDTAEHVEVCQYEGCSQQFDEGRFEWRGTCWRSTCRTCTNKPKHSQQATDPDRRCTRCSELKPATGFHGQECRDCRSGRERENRKAKCDNTSPDTTPGKPCTKCDAAFSAPAFKWQGDRWSSWCRTCFNKAQYYEAYRAKKLNEDKEEYIQHTRHTSTLWRERAKADLDASWRAFKVQAANREKTIESDDEQDMRRMLAEPCQYCGYAPASGEALNSLDSVDSNNRHYSLANVVTCCTPCNRLKGRSTVGKFLDRAWEEAQTGDFDPLINRADIVAAYRSLSSHEPDRAFQSFRHEQLCFVAQRHGFEF